MNTLQHRVHIPSNISVISIVQRLSDIGVIFTGLYLVSALHRTVFDDQHLLLLMTAMIAFVTVAGFTNFYRSWRGMHIYVELFSITRNWIVTAAATWLVLSCSAHFTLSFDVLMHWFLLVAVGLTASRSVIRYLSGTLRKYGYNNRRVCVAGSMPAGIALLKSFGRSPWLGFVVKGVYDDVVSNDLNGLPYAGNLAELIREARDGEIDRIYIAMHMKDEAKISELVKQLADTTCSVLLVPDVSALNILQSHPEDINGVPVVPLVDTPFNGINRVLKRLEDIVLSSLILLLISPILLAVAIAVKLSSPGPVLFRQTRYGIDGKPIVVWKFRSMSVMENDAKVMQVTRGDVRVTQVGRFLRKTSLDELPQFFNVFRGEMSIVGPRPHAVAHNEQYRMLIHGYMLRHKVKPGITGLAQINGWRGETDTLDKMQKRIDLDLEYIRSWSIPGDLKIIFLTLLKGFVNKSGY